MSRTTSCGSLWLAAVAAVCGGSALADDKPAAAKAGEYRVTIQVPDGGNVLVGQPPHAVARNQILAVVHATGEYWVGLHCQPVGGALRSHLSLPGGVGLVVQDVVADSPAAKAGLKPHDVLVRFDKAELRTIGDLSKAVEKAKTTAASVEFVRGGKNLTVTVAPVKRPSRTTAGMALSRIELKGEHSPKIIALLQKVGADKQGVFELKLVGPGVAVAPKAKATRTEKMTIRIEKSGEGKAKITVTRDGKTWETTEDKLDKLPRDIRVRIEKALKPGAPVPAKSFDFSIDGKKFGPGFRGVWVQQFRAGGGFWKPALPAQPPIAARAHAQGIRVFQTGGTGPIDKKLEEINKKLDALQKAIESLKKK